MALADAGIAAGSLMVLAWGIASSGLALAVGAVVVLCARAWQRIDRDRALREAGE